MMPYGEMMGVTGAVSISTSPVAQEPFPAFPIGAGTASIWGEVGTGCESPGRLGVSRVCSQALRPGGTLLHLSGPAVAWGPRAGAAEGQQQGEESQTPEAVNRTIKYNLETIWALGLEYRDGQRSGWGGVGPVLAGAQAGVI